MLRLAPQVVLVLLTVLVLQAVDGSEQDERVSRAIAQLGASQYADREAASRQLAAMGVIAVDQLLVQQPQSHFLGLHAPADRQLLHPLQRAALKQLLDRHIDLHRVERLLATHVRLAQSRQPPAEPVLSIKQVQLGELIEACHRSTRQKTPMRQKRLPDVSTNISV
jgi:hypothetical protein